MQTLLPERERMPPAGAGEGLAATPVAVPLRVPHRALSNARLMLLGGEPMDGPRHIWWNFVTSSKGRIDAAKADWKSGKFARVPGDEKHFISLPD